MVGVEFFISRVPAAPSVADDEIADGVASREILCHLSSGRVFEEQLYAFVFSTLAVLREWSLPSHARSVVWSVIFHRGVWHNDKLLQFICVGWLCVYGQFAIVHAMLFLVFLAPQKILHGFD